MARPLIIGNCSGFFGDRLAAAREMVTGGPIDVLTGDWLAELTMLILAKARSRTPGAGYASTFLKQMGDVLEECLDRGIRIVSNAGGLNPAGLAQAIADLAAERGRTPKIAYVTGDDVLEALPGMLASGAARPFPNSPEIDPDKVVSANAYIGGWGVVEALRAGADVVITGRTTDAALVCAPAAWWHDWARDDWDRLAGAVVAGHVIECGTQATGGNYSFFTEVADMRRIGFPWAEIHEDGSAVIGKHPGTGGVVNRETVLSQLLYEIGSPLYLGPDVDARFDTLAVTELDTDRVRVSGAVGQAPSGLLKTSINMIGGYRNDLSVALVGLDIERKAELLTELFWDACPYTPEDYDAVDVRVQRTDVEDPDTSERATATWSITLKSTRPELVGRRASGALVELALASIPGFYLLSGPPSEGREFGVHASALVPLAAAHQTVHLFGGAEIDVADLDVTERDAQFAPEVAAAEETEPITGDTRRVPLGQLVGSRSGDKGGAANLGLYVRDPRVWPWLDAHLTTERLRELIPEAADLAVDRHRLPNLHSLNFVIHGFLGDGVAASTRIDAQAKSLGEWIRARAVDVPVALLD
ncbi:acyclic terpene utilization AtuA family protein [Microbacterium gorillae]|uniref:acyclic terpene utilization AtuA family protein n=1 Tax=Microbacterium gorillae TaxID=1231063 RepID=UPI00058C5C9F|nr:acyclic terpene utilization AtuA family protein [Microbacterium gorillae]